MGRRVWDWYREDFIEVPAPKAPQRSAAELDRVRPDLPGSLGEDGAVISPQYAPDQPPMRSGAFLCPRWGRYLVVLLGAAAFGTQLVLAWVGYYLVDLSLDLMEVWVQLARKHLEITL